LTEPFAITIAAALRGAAKACDGALAPHGLTVSTFAVLYASCEANGRSQSEIAGALGVPATAVHKAASELEAAGLVSRLRSNGDARRLDVSATPAGHDRLRAALDALSDLERRLAIPADAPEILRALARGGEAA